MIKKIFVVFLFLVFIFFVSLKIFAPSLCKLGINALNDNSDVYVTYQDARHEFPIKMNFDNVKISLKNAPIFFDIDNMSIKALVLPFFLLTEHFKLDANLYNGNLKMNAKSAFIEDDVNMDYNMENVVLSSHPMFSLFPVSGGNITSSGDIKLYKQDEEIKNINGKFSLTDFNVKEKFTLKKEITNLMLDIIIPELTVNNFEFLYDINKEKADFDKIKLTSSLVNIDGVCNINLETKNYKLCHIGIKFTDEGWDMYKDYVNLFTNQKIATNKKFTVVLSKSIYYPTYKIKD